jgi:hypothetical protein
LFQGRQPLGFPNGLPGRLIFLSRCAHWPASTIPGS